MNERSESIIDNTPAPPPHERPRPAGDRDHQHTGPDRDTGRDVTSR